MPVTPAMSERQGEFGFPKALHLRRPVEFRRVFAHKCSVSDGPIVIYGKLNDLGYSRLGMSVSRKVGSAVARNRLRRLLREAFRLGRAELPAGIDLVVVQRGSKAELPQELQETLTRLCHALARKLARGGAPS